MRKQTSHPHQTSFGLELDAHRMPPVDGDDGAVKDPGSFAITVPDHLSVYTVTLKRTDVVSRQCRTVIRSPGDAAKIFRDRLQDVDREQLLVMMLDTKLSVIGLNTVSILASGPPKPWRSAD